VNKKTLTVKIIFVQTFVDLHFIIVTGDFPSQFGKGTSNKQTISLRWFSSEDTQQWFQFDLMPISPK